MNEFMRNFSLIIAAIAATLSAHAVWLSPDPLLDKYPNISPYAYCNNNPIKNIDPDGLDWYEAEEGTAVLWKNLNDASVNIDGVKYNNIGENYSHTIDNATYGYHQNELQTIEYSTNTTFYKQSDGTGCKRACDLMIESSGFAPEKGRRGELLIATHDENGVVNGTTSNYMQGLYRLEAYITNGMPCIVGVDYKSKQEHNLTSNGGDGMTDHFVTIVGLIYNLADGTAKYRFFDPGSRKGANLDNIITPRGNYLTGYTAARRTPFIVTTIRRTLFKTR